MPMCHFHTNIPDAEIKEGVEERLAKGIAEVLKKPLEKMVVMVIPGIRLLRMGTSEPACTVNINSIGVFDKERNPSYTEPIKELVMNEFNLTKERVTLVYQDLPMHMVGW